MDQGQEYTPGSTAKVPVVGLCRSFLALNCVTSARFLSRNRLAAAIRLAGIFQSCYI